MSRVALQHGGCPKKKAKWRVFVDYTNDAYPNDTFPLPWIDKIVDETTSHELLSFLNAYSGDSYPKSAILSLIQYKF